MPRLWMHIRVFCSATLPLRTAGPELPHPQAGSLSPEACYADGGRRIAAGAAAVVLAACAWAGELARTEPGDRHRRE